jgi:phosphate transport system substrate-binding protein
MSALALLLATAATAGAQPQPPPTLELSGSPTTALIAADLAYFYRHAVRRAPRISIVGGGTEIGISDAARGVVDAGMASRGLTASDPPGLVYTPIAFSGVCLATHRSNRVPSLSRAQIQDLVAGRLVSWAAVPGAARSDAIVPAANAEAGGARIVFLQTFVDLTTPILYRPHAFLSATQMRNFIRVTPGALGYLDVAFTAGLHAVPYEGVPCTRATIRSGAYPARRPLGLVTRGRPRGAVARFLRWIARSRTARRVIATRYAPAAGVRAPAPASSAAGRRASASARAGSRSAVAPAA